MERLCDIPLRKILNNISYSRFDESNQGSRCLEYCSILLPK